MNYQDSSMLTEVEYRGEKYQIETTIYTDEDGLKYTTTESDMEWWMDLRTQYITRHPEVLQKFMDDFPPSQLKENDGTWIAFKNKETGEGKTKEEAIKNLYICLAE